MIKNSMRKVLDWLCLTETGKVILFFILFLLMFLCGCSKQAAERVLDSSSFPAELGLIIQHSLGY